MAKWAVPLLSDPPCACSFILGRLIPALRLLDAVGLDARSATTRCSEERKVDNNEAAAELMKSL